MLMGVSKTIYNMYISLWRNSLNIPRLSELVPKKDFFLVKRKEGLGLRPIGDGGAIGS